MAKSSKLARKSRRSANKGQPESRLVRGLIQFPTYWKLRGAEIKSKFPSVRFNLGKKF